MRRSLGHRDQDRAKTYALEQAAKLKKGDAELRQGKVTLTQVIDLYLLHRSPRKGEREQETGLSLGFLDATVSSGKLALIRDSKLRASLARTSGILEDLAEVLAYALELSLEAATLMGRYPEIQIAYVAVEGQQEIAASTLRALRSDTEFMGVSTAKSYYWGAYLNELRRLEAHVKTVVAMIEATLKGLGLTT